MLKPPPSTSSAPAGIVGHTEPRLWTPPLRELTPETSYGFEVIDFADTVLGAPLDPWEQWLVIHAGELLPDGRPRFRIVLVLVARQNGKTHVLVVLSLYWVFVERVELVLGTSTKLEYAAESWKKACKLARAVPSLRREIPKRGGIRRANGEQTLWRADRVEQIIDAGSRYKIAAANEDAGRSLTVDRLVLDELRQHHDRSAWDAAVPATSAVPDAQVFALSNEGGDKSIVLHEERDTALRFIETGEGDPRVGLFEWSAPPGASPLDVNALAQANPNLGHRKDPDTLLAEAAAAVAAGGDKLAGFRIEHMCQRVKKLDPAIDPDRWADCLQVGDLEAVRDRVALCMDVSLDAEHATLYAAAVLDDGRVRVDPVAAWSGLDAPKQLRTALPELVAQVKPKALGWFPAGPAAALAADMAEREGWPPEGVQVEEIRSATTAVCMGFAELVTSNQVAHSGDPLLTAHVEAAEKAHYGDAWRFTRKGVGHVDACYAAAGAAHLARTLPTDTDLGPFVIR